MGQLNALLNLPVVAVENRVGVQAKDCPLGVLGVVCFPNHGLVPGAFVINCWRSFINASIWEAVWRCPGHCPEDRLSASMDASWPQGTKDLATIILPPLVL